MVAIMPFAWTTGGPPIELGAKVLPKTRAAYARIGSQIIAGGRERRVQNERINAATPHHKTGGFAS